MTVFTRIMGGWPLMRWMSDALFSCAVFRMSPSFMKIPKLEVKVKAFVSCWLSAIGYRAVGVGICEEPNTNHQNPRVDSDIGTPSASNQFGFGTTLPVTQAGQEERDCAGYAG